MPASESELRRFTCDFLIPGELMPMFVIGKPLASLINGAMAAVRVIDGKPRVLINNEPAFRLERFWNNTFSMSGFPRESHCSSRNRTMWCDRSSWI